MFSPQQTDEKLSAPGPPRPMPNQRMMGRRPPNLQRPSFGPQQQGFQQSGQFLPQANAGARNGAGGGLKGMLSKFLPGGGGTGGAGVPGAGTAASGGAGLQGIQNIANPASLSSMLGNVQKCSAWRDKSPHDPAVRPISPQSASNDKAVQPVK